jgi:hypothetical protein
MRCCLAAEVPPVAVYPARYLVSRAWQVSQVSLEVLLLMIPKPHHSSINCIIIMVKLMPTFTAHCMPASGQGTKVIQRLVLGPSTRPEQRYMYLRYITRRFTHQDVTHFPIHGDCSTVTWINRKGPSHQPPAMHVVHLGPLRQPPGPPVCRSPEGLIRVYFDRDGDGDHDS